MAIVCEHEAKRRQAYFAACAGPGLNS